MALPSSGQLSFSAIGTELGLSSSNLSLRSMSNQAGFSTPDTVSEFYGYSAITYGYYGTFYKQDPCISLVQYDIYSGSDGKVYVYNGSSYVLASSISTNWYIYQYFDDMFWLYVYAQYKATTSSFIYFNDYYSSCGPY